MITKSIVCCGLTCATDGSQDGEITCFKENTPCSEGREMLRHQMEYMNAVEENPFLPDEEDKMEAAPGSLLIDESEDDDDFIDV